LVLENPQRLALHATATITVPINAPRADRYQAARLSDWLQPTEPDSYAYRLTPASLRRAQLQGIDLRQAQAFLQRASGAPLPPAVRASSEALLLQLQQHPQVGRFLGERLGPLTVMVPERSWEKLRSALLAYGLLLDCELVDADDAPED